MLDGGFFLDRPCCWGDTNLTALPLIDLDMLAKNSVNGDMFTYGLAVHGFSAITNVAEGGIFILIVRVGAGAGFGAIGLPKKENTGCLLCHETLEDGDGRG